MKDDFDSACRTAITNANMLVPWYLIASYAYYHKDAPLISDALYDEICKRLDKEWDGIEHRHKGFVDRDSLSAGTAYTLAQKDYPLIAVNATNALGREMERKQ